jgi:hypothetical protein
MILYLKDPKDSTKTLLDLINTFDNIAEYKISIQEIRSFSIYPIMNRLKNQENNTSCKSLINTKIHRYKLNQGGGKPLQ